MADSAAPPPGTGLPDINRGPEILAVSGALVAFSAIFVALRFYVRVRITKNVSWDDWTVLASWIIVFVELMIFIPQVQYGAGKHAAYINPPSNISKGLKLNFITQPLCMVAITLVKTSIGLFLLRLTPTVIHRRIVQVTVALTIAANFAYIVILFNQCRPLPALWGEVKGTCMTGAQLRFATFFNACFGILTDLILALIPIPMLYNLQMNWKLKIAVCGVLSLGLFAASAAAVKVYFTENFGKKGDFLWDATDLTIWTTVEICVAIIACSIPTLKKLFKTQFRGSSLDNTYPNQSRSGYMQHMSSSKKRTNPSTNRSNISEPDFEMYTRSKKPEVKISGPRGKDKLDPDNISEESFIQHGNGTIRKTVQVYQV